MYSIHRVACVVSGKLLLVAQLLLKYSAIEQDFKKRLDKPVFFATGI